jgi:hypothetical protein
MPLRVDGCVSEYCTIAPGLFSPPLGEGIKSQTAAQNDDTPLGRPLIEAPTIAYFSPIMVCSLIGKVVRAWSPMLRPTSFGLTTT